MPSTPFSCSLAKVKIQFQRLLKVLKVGKWPVSAERSFSMCILLQIINIISIESYFYLLQVDSANKHGILLEMVQVLTDLDLVISKSYISSDGGWFMDGWCSSYRPFFCAYIYCKSILKSG